MQHTYQIDGMTCQNCVRSVTEKLKSLDDVQDVRISLDEKEATITMGHHYSVSALQDALGGAGSKYQIRQNVPNGHTAMEEPAERNWLETYKPILLVFAFITGVTLINQWLSGGFSLMSWMPQFMAGFFLVFAFFKLLDVRGFADAYRTYDIVAAKVPAWGVIYPFVELGLGIAFLIGIAPVATYSVTLVVMGVSIIGVLQSVLNKRKIRCACLGTGFNLPMSTVTIIEDGLMIVMSAWMLLSVI